MREAQAEIKATVSVNTGDGLSAKQEGKDPGKDDTKKKGQQFRNYRYSFKQIWNGGIDSDNTSWYICMIKD